MPNQQSQQDLLGNWVWHKDAALMMGVNEKYLRVKDARGHYLYWPHLDRIQPVARGRIYLLRDQVAAWKQQQEQAAAMNKPPELRAPEANPFNGLREEFLANGWTDTLKKLGVQI